MSITLQSLLLDTLSFTFEVPLAQRDAFAREVTARGTRIETRRAVESGYRHAFTIPHPDGRGSFAFVGYDPYRPFARYARIECNPSKYPVAVRMLHALLTPFLPPQRWIAVRLSRVDLAVDYPIALQAFIACARNQKSTVYNGPSRIESIYLGAKRATKRVLLYDKVAELAARAQPTPEHPVTRIEARIRPTGMSILDLPDLSNPFLDLVLGRPVATGWPLKYRLYAKEAAEAGFDGIAKELGRHERRRLREMLAASPVPFTHPQKIFDRDFGRAAQAVISELTGNAAQRRRRTASATGGKP